MPPTHEEGCGVDRFGRQRRSMTVAIIGSGVVGTATGFGLQGVGHRVIFCDLDPERLMMLRSRGFMAMECGELPLEEPNVDAYLISVPSPTVDGRVDLTYVREAAAAVGCALGQQEGHPVVVLRSTVPPGTTEDVVIPVLEGRSGRTAGRDFGVCMNPEFLRARSAETDFRRPRVIVIGSIDAHSEHALRRVYAPWTDVPVVATDLRTAEATKYMANLFNAAKISFFNEMAEILTTLGADPTAAAGAVALGAEGMWNPAYGTRSGAPYGGACLPKDMLGFLGLLEERGLSELAPILLAVNETNDRVAAAAPLEEIDSPQDPRRLVVPDMELTR